MAEDAKTFHWHSAVELNPRGLGWLGEERENFWDRFPLELKDKIEEPLWNLGTESAGIYVDFQTDAREIRVRWEMAERWAFGGYETGCGISGFDLYGRDEKREWRWAGSFFTGNDCKGEGTLTRMPLDGVAREYRLYFPLRRRVLSVEVGADAEVTAVPPDTLPPIAYYGTSIVHGAGVGRPGMTHAAQLGRALDREVLNLGVCGRARCEPPVAEALSRLNPCLYLIDVLPNNGAPEVPERVSKLLHILRNRHRDIPILLLGDRVYGDAAFMPGRAVDFQQKNEALTRVVEEAKAAGLDPLHLHLAADWYGEDGEGTTDASHPNDLGAHRMAVQLIPLVRELFLA
ncbi:MAG: SGNH/GDSL hydrolase family protein [Verrucomicrobia bacterium]|nr:SGNH/GDSL hydrolase family protein [Verrucomicrobiota bacterium]MCH8514256.1 SGNH/GDSL hydrolase family protein [Kiritimatiellia bacterium]